MPEIEKILRMRSVLQRTGLSRSTIYRKMKDGTFPGQIHISEHCRGWRESAINRWMADPEHYVDDVTTLAKDSGQNTSLPTSLNSTSH